MTAGQKAAATRKANQEKNSGFIPEFQISFKRKGNPAEQVQVTNSESMAEVLRKCFEADSIDWVESFIVVALNTACKVVGFYKVSSGGVTGTVADPKVVFQFALLSNATSIILAHNHPSGSLKPSRADEALTEKLAAAGKVLDIKVLDHIIMTSESYYSFADEGMMP